MNFVVMILVSTASPNTASVSAALNYARAGNALLCPADLASVTTPDTASAGTLNFASVLVLVLVAAAVVAAIIYLRRHGLLCSKACEGCALKSTCRKAK